ncbi:MAG: guanylate kinase [Chitinophagales bacterium]
MQGKLIIFTAPSGSGKTTLVKYLLKQDLNLSFSVSATTREKRAKETDGKDYHFISYKEFLQKIENGDFLEYQEVYDGNYYGTLHKELERVWAMGKHIIFDIDVEGALNIKRAYGERVLTVFVRPPSIQVIEQRLRRRDTESKETLRQRLDKAVAELAYESRFDVSVLNDDLDTAKIDAYETVSKFLVCEKVL